MTKPIDVDPKILMKMHEQLRDREHKSYYMRQLTQLQPREPSTITVKFTDYDGVATNHMSLSKESISDIIEYLQALYQYYDQTMFEEKK